MLGYAVISGLAYARIYYIPPRNLNIVFRLPFVKQPPPQAPRSQCWEGALGDPVFFLFLLFACIAMTSRGSTLKSGGGGQAIGQQMRLGIYFAHTGTPFKRPAWY